MGDFLVDLLLPKTDRVVAYQWIVMIGVVWPIAIFAVRKADRDIKHFVWGLAMLNLAWFAARTVH